MPSVVKGFQACRLPWPLPPVFKGVQACRLPALKRLKPLKPSAAASTRHSGHCPLLLRAFKPAVCQPSGDCPPVCQRQFTALCCYRRSSVPFASPQTPKTLKTLRGSFDPALRPLPSVVKGLQACRLPAVRPLPALKRLKPLKSSATASTRHSGHCPLLLRAFKPAVCQPSGHCSVAYKGVQASRLPALKRLKPLNSPRQLRPGTQATALCC